MSHDEVLTFYYLNKLVIFELQFNGLSVKMLQFKYLLVWRSDHKDILRVP